MSEKISVIIPCYNVEPYVEKCLKSVLLQTYENLEVIIINDGSTDSTAEIVRRFTDDSRIKYIDQNNAGVSAARNVGIDLATGDLLGFVDSDDFLEVDMYEKLYSALSEADADMAVCNYNLMYDNRIENQYSNMQKQTVNIQDDVYGYFIRFCVCPRPNNYIWTRLYKSGIVKKSSVRFEQYKLGDDTLFNFKLLPHIGNVAFIPEGLYNYYQRKNSNVFTAANRVNLAKVYADTFESLINHYMSNGFKSYLEAMPIHAYTRLRSVIFYSRLAGLDDTEIAQSIQDGFENREIVKYLQDVSGVDKYAVQAGLAHEAAGNIKRAMRAAADNPKELIGAVFT